MRNLVCIAGNIGVGKTSLTGLLGKKLGMEPYYEKAQENPYLALFYQDMPRWALPSQLFFLKERMLQSEAMGRMQSVISDRSIYEDAEVFAQNLFEQHVLSKNDWSLYLSFYEYIRKQTPPPTLLIYLSASVPTLVGRISDRGRSYEKTLPEAYLGQLNQRYEAWFRNYALGAKMEIATDSIDFIKDPADLDNVLMQCKKALAEV